MARTAKNKFGQYFTPDHVAAFMISLYSGRPDPRVLEPCCGDGVFLRTLAGQGFRQVEALEVDATLSIDSPYPVRRESFVSAPFDTPFDLIVGNPPYIRWKHLDASLKAELDGSALWRDHCNSLCDYATIFMLKAVSLLAEGGQLIFITPEYWLSTQHARGLRAYLVQNGYLEEIYHFNETPIFDGVAASIVIFKFTKAAPSVPRPPVRLIRYHSRRRLAAEALALIRAGSADGLQVLDLPPFEAETPWLLANREETARLAQFEAACSRHDGYHRLHDIADIGNGMVSGLDRAFQLPPDLPLSRQEEAATLRVTKAHQLSPFAAQGSVRYLHLPDGVDEAGLAREYPAFHAHLAPFRERLLARYAYGRPLPYWQWAFRRSQALFARPVPRLFVPCKERISHKRYFRFAWVEAGVYPTQDVTAILLKPGVPESLFYLLAWLNSPAVFEWLRIKGVVKGNIVEFSERPLAGLPVRRINWEDPREAALHDAISGLAHRLARGGSPALKADLDALLTELLAHRPAA